MVKPGKKASAKALKKLGLDPEILMKHALDGALDENEFHMFFGDFRKARAHKFLTNLFGLFFEKVPVKKKLVGKLPKMKKAEKIDPPLEAIVNTLGMLTFYFPNPRASALKAFDPNMAEASEAYTAEMKEALTRVLARARSPMDKFFATMVHDASQLHLTATVKRLATDNMAIHPTLHGERLSPGESCFAYLCLRNHASESPQNVAEALSAVLNELRCIAAKHIAAQVSVREQNRLLALLFMFRDLLTLEPLRDVTFAQEAERVIHPFYLWTTPFSSEALRVLRTIQRELCAPGYQMLKHHAEQSSILPETAYSFLDPQMDIDSPTSPRRPLFYFIDRNSHETIVHCEIMHLRFLKDEKYQQNEGSVGEKDTTDGKGTRKDDVDEDADDASLPAFLSCLGTDSVVRLLLHTLTENETDRTMLLNEIKRLTDEEVIQAFFRVSRIMSVCASDRDVERASTHRKAEFDKVRQDISKQSKDNAARTKPQKRAMTLRETLMSDIDNLATDDDGEADSSEKGEASEKEDDDSPQPVLLSLRFLSNPLAPPSKDSTKSNSHYMMYTTDSYLAPKDETIQLEMATSKHRRPRAPEHSRDNSMSANNPRPSREPSSPRKRGNGGSTAHDGKCRCLLFNDALPHLEQIFYRNAVYSNDFSPATARIVIAGGNDVLHRVLCAYVSLLHEHPGREAHAFRFFLVPFEENLLASFIARFDSWYKRHIYIPFRAQPFLLPKYKSQAVYITRGTMSDHPLSLPGSIFQNLVEHYAEAADVHSLDVTLFKVDCWWMPDSERADLGMPPLGQTPDVTIPFCMSVDLGFNASVRNYMQQNPQASHKEARRKCDFVGLRLDIQAQLVDEAGKNRARVEDEESSFQTVVLAHVPLGPGYDTNSRTGSSSSSSNNDQSQVYPADPTVSSLEMHTNHFEEPKTKKAHPFFAEKRQQVRHTNIRCSKVEDRFHVLIDDQLFGPFYAINVSPIELPSFENGQLEHVTMPIQTFFPYSGIH